MARGVMLRRPVPIFGAQSKDVRQVHLEDVVDERPVFCFKGEVAERFRRERLVPFPRVADLGPARLKEEGELIIFHVLCERMCERSVL